MPILVDSCRGLDILKIARKTLLGRLGFKQRA